MAINRMELKDFLVFKGDFTAEFCPGVNVLIGGNATGKTTLLKIMYSSLKEYDIYYQHYLKAKDNIENSFLSIGLARFNAESVNEKSEPKTVIPLIPENPWSDRVDELFGVNGHLNNENEAYYKTYCYGVKGEITIGFSEKPEITSYIPEKDILEHAKGLLTFIEQKQTGFSQIYKDVLVNAQDVPTQKQSETQKIVGQKIAETIGGNVHWDKGDGYFYTLRTDGTRIPFTNEASGYKKLGFLGLLVTSGQLENGSVLFWDEPENSLNPGLVTVLVDILLHLAENGVQIFIATHDYHLARYFDVRKDKSVPVMFHNLSKADNDQIVCQSSQEYVKLPDNLLEKASKDLFNAVVKDAMGMHDNEQ